MFQIPNNVKTVWPLAVLFAFCWWQPQLASAAGCQYYDSTETHGQLGVFAEDVWWAVGPTRRVYENGQFTYHQIPTDSLPCNGPSCRGRAPKDSVGSPVVTEVQRQPLFGHGNSGCLPSLAPRSDCEIEVSEFPHSPTLSGLLRPPRREA